MGSAEVAGDVCEMRELERGKFSESESKRFKAATQIAFKEAPKEVLQKLDSGVRISETSSRKSRRPPCVGGDYHQNRGCTLRGTRPMNRRARNAPATSRRTWGCSVPVVAAHQRRPRTTHGKRIHHPEKRHKRQHPPVPRPQQKKKRQATFGHLLPRQEQTRTSNF